MLRFLIENRLLRRLQRVARHPFMPALIFCSIAQMPVAAVFVAVLFGKLIKYAVIAALAAPFAAKFRACLNVIEPVAGKPLRYGWS